MAACKEISQAKDEVSTLHPCFPKPALQNVEDCRQLVKRLCNQSRPLSTEEVDQLVSPKREENVCVCVCVLV